VWGTDIRSGPINQAFTVSVIRIDHRTFWEQELIPNQNLFSHRKKISLSFFIYEKYVIYFQMLSPPPSPPENVTVVLFFFFIFQVNLCVSIKLVKHSTIYHTRGEYAIIIASLMQFIFIWRCIESYPSLYNNKSVFLRIQYSIDEMNCTKKSYDIIKHLFVMIWQWSLWLRYLRGK
jgi:hypothetical protein